MKTFTCREMGGPCDAEIHGSTMEEVAENGAQHVKSMSDPEHGKIADQMKDESPKARQEWFAWFKGLWDAKAES